MVLASPGSPMTTILAGMAPTGPPGRTIPIVEARKTSIFMTEPLASSHRAMLKRRTKIILVLMSLMRDLRDLLWEMSAIAAAITSPVTNAAKHDQRLQAW